jgi:hypothetical protein
MMPGDMAVRIDRRRLLAQAAAMLAGAGAGVLSTSPAVAQDAPVAIEVNARSIAAFNPRDPSQTRFGALEFRGGLVLTSSFRGFGGLSGFRLDRTGETFLALSDRGRWFTGRLVHEGGRVAGLTDVTTAPILGPDGRKLTQRGWFDSESLARDGATVYVGFERVNKILRFDFAKGGLLARGQVVAAPAGVDTLPFNRGFEALVVVPKGLARAGTLIALSEAGLDAAGNIQGFLIGGPSPGAFAVARSGNFDISDATLLPSGDLLLLERKFSLLEGLGIRLRRVPLSAVVPGAVVDGPIIFDVDLGYEIDNMEGIDSHVSPGGETILTMVSDDNFSMIQRTMLLQFALVAE